MQGELSASDTSTHFRNVVLDKEHYECWMFAQLEIDPPLGVWRKVRKQSSSHAKGGAEPPVHLE